jgi:cation diffusion facilitator family transporter
MASSSPSLKKFLYLSIAAAVVTIGLKSSAYLLTGSVGLLSDALESGINLIAAVVALSMIILAERPADEEHSFGHSKAEYFSSGVEGGLIVFAAASIVWIAVPRLIHPQALENINIGLLISVGGSLINFGVARVLLAAGRNNNSITLKADGMHLMTDVWTSAGVLIGIALVKITGLIVFDPLVALAVASNIVWTGYRLMHSSVLGLLDTAIPQEERDQLKILLGKYQSQDIQYHSLLTRQSGQRKFIVLHILVPGTWTVQQGHNALEKIESDIRNHFQGPVTVFTHLEPVKDPLSMDDIGIERVEREQ